MDRVYYPDWHRDAVLELTPIRETQHFYVFSNDHGVEYRIGKEYIFDNYVEAQNDIQMHYDQMIADAKEKCDCEIRYAKSCRENFIENVMNEDFITKHPKRFSYKRV